MTESEAQQWVEARFGRSALDRLQDFAELVTDENDRQNLIAPASVPTIWSRHIADSAQLLNWAPASARSWLDVGTGAGFPGIVIATLVRYPVVMVEPRTRRVEFLSRCIATLGLDHARVIRVRAEQLPRGEYGVISARAVASLDTLLDMTAHLRGPATRYVLPRGRGARDDVAGLKRSAGLFHVEHSVTDPTSLIVIADGVPT